MFQALLMSILSLAVAQDPASPLDVPTPKPGKVGRYIGLKAETKGEVVIWKALSEGIDFIDPIFAPKDQRVTGVIADVPGTYKVMAITAVENKPYFVVVEVVFEGKEPPPPPKPPVPPGPSNDLSKKLKAAYEADPAPKAVKDGQKVLLCGLYDAMTVHAQKKEILTTGKLLDDMKATASSMIIPGALVECRKIISAEIVKELGDNPNAKLDPDLRPKAVEVFARITKSLTEI